MKRRTSGISNKVESGKWLTTYADLMNNLLVFFMLLYILSVVDLQKFMRISNSFVETFLGATPQIVYATPHPDSPVVYVITDPDATATPEPSSGDTVSSSPTETPTASPSATQEPDLVSDEEYDALYARINLLLQEKGYVDQVSLEKKSDIIYLRFREGVFFYPDSPELKTTAYPIIYNISSIILDSYDLIAGIDISGHTAKVRKDPPSKTNLFSWELSTDRALTVLKYLVQQCDMPQEKLSVTGYSCNQLYIEGEEEEFLAQNRRVEIRLSRNTEAESDVSANNN